MISSESLSKKTIQPKISKMLWKRIPIIASTNDMPKYHTIYSKYLHCFKQIVLLVTYTYCSCILKANKALHYQMSNETNKGVLIPGGNDLIIERSHANMKCHKPFNFTGLFHLLFTKEIWDRTDSRLGSSQWEMSLQSYAVSHWLGTKLESALWYMCNPKCQSCKCHRTGGVSQHMVGSPTVYSGYPIFKDENVFIVGYSLCHKWYNFL